MDSLDNKNSDKEQYNEDPVYFCKRCLSLNVRQVPYMKDMDYCENCGATDIESTGIEEWEAMYKNKYGIAFLVKDDKVKRRY